MMKNVLILRGTSCSGKTTLAAAIKSLNPEKTLICCADDYFYVNGEYKFDANELGRAHNQCKMLFLSGLKTSVPFIIVANTNVKERDFNYYKERGEEWGYTVSFAVVEKRHANENAHGCPAETIAKQEALIMGNLKLT